MSKVKRRYNWKARQVVETLIDKEAANKISLDTTKFPQQVYDECNVLALPSAKRATARKKDQIQVTKILSKKQRKKLEKIVDAKKKKENRVSLLEALSKVQVAPEFTAQLTSIATVQTRGLKRHIAHSQLNDAMQSKDLDEMTITPGKRFKISSIAGSRKLRKKLLPPPDPRNNSSFDPNILTFESLSSSSQSEESCEEIVSENDDEEKSKDIDDNDTGANKKEIVEEITKDCLLKIVNENSTTNAALKQDPKDCEPSVFVPVFRSAAMQAARMKLPILAEEQMIMETIRENSVVVLAGETGSGKTTQVPQFLYEGGYARNGKLIGVTEPRRVAAISMSKRVGQEMGLSEKEVSYLIRFEGSAGPDTRILFMTDGVLLREARHDFLLSRYSVIIVDEAHERSVFTDILVGLLSRIVNLRARRGDPLKLVIMSATLRLADFTENSRLFKTPPPVVKVESRQYPVTVHFARRTATDYVTEAFRKTCKVHTQLPEGGILVFLTGQQEVRTLVRRLRRAFPYTGQHHLEDFVEEEMEKGGKITKRKAKPLTLPSINLDAYPLRAVDIDDDADSADSDLSSDEDEKLGVNVTGSCQPLWVLPLYSLLPSLEQARVFDSPPNGTRLCVVATNVAETSLTIPGVKYVIDSGRAKNRNYDKITGVSTFQVVWTSKASADQRAGRAGRIGPGHCYRLYSSAVFNDSFPQFAEPDIRRRPVDDLIVQMKALGIHKVVNFPFPSAPDLLQLRAAERRLTLLGILEVTNSGKNTEEQFSGRLTALGKSISNFPVAPRYGKMLALSAQQPGLLPHAVNLVAALSVPELLLNPGKVGKACTLTGQSKLLGDLSVLLRVMYGAEKSAQRGEQNLLEFCGHQGLRHKGVLEVRKLRAQLTSEINLHHPDIELVLDPKLPPPTENQARLLRQIVLSGMVDQVAIRVVPEDISDPAQRVKLKYAYRCAELEDPVVMHSHCILRKEKPQWIVYQEIFETSKLYLRGVTAIEPEWLPVYAPTLCNLSQPLPDPPPRYDSVTERLLCSVTGSYGRAGWELLRMEIDFPKGLDRYKFFAQQFLEGNIFPKLKKYRSSLLSTPATITKSWANLVGRTITLVTALVEQEIDNKGKLLELFNTNPQCLLAAYQQWLPESAHNEVAMMWPPI